MILISWQRLPIFPIFDFLNNPNKTLQGNKITVFKVQYKVETARKNFIFGNIVLKRNYTAFTKLTELQKDYNMSSLPHDTSATIKEVFFRMETNFKEYFKSINSNKVWIRNQFTFKLDSKTNLIDSNI